MRTRSQGGGTPREGGYSWKNHEELRIRLGSCLYVYIGLYILNRYVGFNRYYTLGVGRGPFSWLLPWKLGIGSSVGGTKGHPTASVVSLCHLLGLFQGMEVGGNQSGTGP